jgi:hypothetical protein
MTGCKEQQKEGSSSFLKKRTKKLLSVFMRASTDKSFLVPFFKKELLPS